MSASPSVLSSLLLLSPPFHPGGPAVPVTYHPDPIVAVYGTPLGAVIEETQVGPDGSVEPLLYWDWTAEKWTTEDSAACLRPMSQRRDGSDPRAQYVAIPRGVLSRPGVVVKLYLLAPDGSRGELRQAMCRRDAEIICGAD